MTDVEIEELAKKQTEGFIKSVRLRPGKTFYLRGDTDNKIGMTRESVLCIEMV
jgi:hypothetical protein